MPELPEVETVVRGLSEPLAGRTILGAATDWPGGLVTPDRLIFAARIAGQPVRRVDRRGKYILITLDPDTLIVHLKMTGRLYVVPDDAEQHADRWVHFTFQLDNAHQLRFSDARKFGRVYLVPDPAEVTGALGPEPLDPAFTLDAFRQCLARRSGLLKPLLLNQAFVAGIGNIYADEALYASQLHRCAALMPDDDIARLYGAIRCWRMASRAKGPASTGTVPDGTARPRTASVPTGRHRPRALRASDQDRGGQRGTHFCPVCQPR